MYYSSSKLAEELVALSGWEPDFIQTSPDGQTFRHFSLGYLLRKLQAVGGHVLPNKEGQWLSYAEQDAFSDPRAYITTAQKADTPEDAVAMLCTLLIKQGLLSPKDTGKGQTNDR